LKYLNKKNMKRLITIAMLAGLLALRIPSSAQDQPPQDKQVSPADQSAPSSQPQTEPAPASPQAPIQASPENQTQTQPAVNPPRPTSKSAKRKKAGTKASTPGRKVVVRNGGARDNSAQLAPGMTKEQELHNRETTTKLLVATDTNLKGIAGRQLTPAQQSLLDQIHTYVRLSKNASDAGDLARAQTLAYKAHLLSDELKK
jgi:hypothetical protein